MAKKNMLEIESFVGADLSSKMPSYMTANMLYYGLNRRSIKDKYIYADLLESCMIFEPKELRGTKKDPVSGYYWSRKEEFIAKYKYKIVYSIVASILSGSNIGICNHIFSSMNNESILSIYFLKLFGYMETICVSIHSARKFKKKIIKAVPLDKVIFFNRKIRDYFYYLLKIKGEMQ